MDKAKTPLTFAIALLRTRKAIQQSCTSLLRGYLAPRFNNHFARSFTVQQILKSLSAVSKGVV